MSQKVIDVFSPTKFKKKGIKRAGFESPKLKIPKIQKIPLFLFLFLILILFSFFFFSLKFSKAEIKIWPLVEELKVSEKLVVDTKADKVDIKNKVIPGEIFEVKESFSEEFQSTGKILKKSEGTIRLFNEYTTQDEVWLAGTRFVSSQGKLFKSKDKIFVPGAKIEGGKIKPSYVDVPVEAAEGGEDYNIGPSDFSIVAFKGTPKYFKYYGKSFEPMRGGGEFPQVKKEDLERAEKSLIEKAKEKAKEIFKNKIPSDYIFPEDAILVEVLEKTSTSKEGEVTQKFNFEIKVKMKTIAFKRDLLDEFSKNYLFSQISDQKEIDLNSKKINLKTEVLDFELGKASLFFEISAKTYPKIDPLYFKKGLAGKKIQEAKLFLLSQPQISKIKMNLFPFWLNKIPEDIRQIEILYPLLD